MILDEYIIIKWHPTNKKHLIEKGCIYTEMGVKVMVKIIDMKINSHVKIHVKCDVCGNDKYISYRGYNKNIKSYKYYCCTNICSKGKNLKTNLKKYGVENPMKVKFIKDRLNKTNVERYGVTTTLLHRDTIKKIKQTTLERYGVEHNSQSQKIKLKKKQTNLKKYGVDSYLKTKEFKEKFKQTCLKKYGVENPSQNDDVKDKIRNTMIEKYGEIYLKYTPKYNPNSIIYLDMLSNKLNLPIQHALNGGEKNFIRYWVDGYIEEYNICIEWDEKYHNNKKQKEKDLIRESIIKEKFNCDIIRINEKKFLNNIEYQTNIIINSINNIIKNKHGNTL